MSERIINRKNIHRLPNHMKREYGTLHGFRASKRKQIRIAREAVRGLRAGCAYTPAYPEIDEVCRLVDEIQSRLSVEKWGR